MMYKCDKCGFECASDKLMKQHKERESLDLTEYQEKINIRKQQKEMLNNYLNSKNVN